jgi:hypothetical protein
VDPAGATALVALLTNGGPWAVVVVVLGVVLRAWRSGEFLPKPTHDTIVAAATQRYVDLLDRFNKGQEAIDKWREVAERAANAAEGAQLQHGDIIVRMEALSKELEEFRDEFHAARVWSQASLAHPPTPPPDRPAPRRTNSREGG